MMIRLMVHSLSLFPIIFAVGRTRKSELLLLLSFFGSTQFRVMIDFKRVIEATSKEKESEFNKITKKK